MGTSSTKQAQPPVDVPSSTAAHTTIIDRAGMDGEAMSVAPTPAAEPERREIAFFDVETTIPWARGQGFALLEFGAILVCPRRLVELANYSTLIRPGDTGAPISPSSVRCNGITQEAVAAAPPFRDVADRVFDILHGRVWAGHNIERFDCARVNEAFAVIGRPAPEPRGIIDTLPLLTNSFGRRAGDMKMASLATYFCLGQQRHRSLDDVRLNLEVLKYCAAVLFLESRLPDLFSANDFTFEAISVKNLGNKNSVPIGTSLKVSSPPDLGFSNRQGEDYHPSCEGQLPASNPNLTATMERMTLNQDGNNAERPSTLSSPENLPSPVITSDIYSNYSGFIEASEVSTESIIASVQFGRRILLHKDVPLQLCSIGLKIQFGISQKFQDQAGRPKLNFVVNTPPCLHHILSCCEDIAQKSSSGSSSMSQWFPVVRRNDYSNCSTIRLHIPMMGNADGPVFSTEIFQKGLFGDTVKLSFSRSDVMQLESLFVPGKTVDAFFSIDLYDFQQRAGIRLVAKRLVLYSS